MMKKVMSVLLCGAMVASFGVTALAEEEHEPVTIRVLTRWTGTVHHGRRH